MVLQMHKTAPAVPPHTYIQELIAEYQLIRQKFLKPKKVPMSLGLVLDTKDCPETPDPVIQKQYRSIVAKVQFAAHWIRFDISKLDATVQLFHFQPLEGLHQVSPSDVEVRRV
jgi:hypothetical protein